MNDDRDKFVKKSIDDYRISITVRKKTWRERIKDWLISIGEKLDDALDVFDD